LGKYRKLFKKLGGSDRPVSFLRYTNTVIDKFKPPGVTTETFTIDPPPIIQDQPGEDISAYFGGGIEQDQRIFKILADSFVDRLPTNTLSDRCEEFLSSITGQQKGGIQYGSAVYIIERGFVKPILGRVQAQYIILARAYKKP
jgi:hypothetical protein